MSTKTTAELVEEVEEVYDETTGAKSKSIYRRCSTQTRYYASQDEFIQIYLKDLSGLLNITSKTELQVLMTLWKYSTYNEKDTEKGNFIVISPKIIKDIVELTKLKPQTIRNCISSLVKNESKLLIKDPDFRSTYYLNPTYFFKGALKDRPKVMQVVLKYVDSNQIQPNDDFEVKEEN